MNYVSMLSTFLSSYLVAFVLLLAVILGMVFGNKRLHHISGWIFVPAGLIGLLLYLSAFIFTVPTDAAALRFPDVFLAIIHAIYATCGMFIGHQEFFVVEQLINQELANLPVLRYAVSLLFWLAHSGALLVTAFAILTSLGQKLLQPLRIRLLSFRRVRLYMIFGAHEESLTLGRDLVREKHSLVFFIDDNPADAIIEQAIAFGAMVHQNTPLLIGGKIDERLMRLAGVKDAMRHRSVHMFILGGDEHFNINLAQAAITYFAKCKISTDRASIILRCGQALDARQLRQFEPASGNCYDVNVFSDEELSARLLVHESPPVDVMTFDKNGIAQNNLHVLVIGFGKVGQNALRHIIMNGQFHGSRFSADVVDLSAEQITGHFKRRYPSLQDAYNITFHKLDVRSDEFYHHLDQWAKTLRYIVISLGPNKMNYELTANLERYFSRFEESKRPVIVVNICDKHYIAATDQKNTHFFNKQHQVYCGEIFTREMDDYMAKAVNLNYYEYTCRLENAQEAWRRANYFSRASSRASADFIPAMVRIAGLTMEQAADSVQFERAVALKSDREKILGITEHLRWNAFHFANGFTEMPISEVETRAAEQVAPIHKDTFLLKHACLVPWAELDKLSETVGKLTGNPDLNYKAMDIENVRKIPQTLTMKKKIDSEAR